MAHESAPYRLLLFISLLPCWLRLPTGLGLLLEQRLGGRLGLRLVGPPLGLRLGLCSGPRGVLHLGLRGGLCLGLRLAPLLALRLRLSLRRGARCSSLCSMTVDTLDRARLQQGTDEDLLEVPLAGER